MLGNGSPANRPTCPTRSAPFEAPNSATRPSVRDRVAGPAEAPLVAEWMTGRTWPRRGSTTGRWRAGGYLRGQLAGTYSRPLIGSRRARTAATEVYRAAKDPSPRRYDCDPYDLGLHAAIADADLRRPGFGPLLLPRIVASVFARSRVASASCSTRTTETPRRARLCEFVGCTFLGEHEMANRRMALYALPRPRSYSPSRDARRSPRSRASSRQRRVPTALRRYRRRPAPASCRATTAPAAFRRRDSRRRRRCACTPTMTSSPSRAAVTLIAAAVAQVELARQRRYREAMAEKVDARLQVGHAQSQCLVLEERVAELRRAHHAGQGDPDGPLARRCHLAGTDIARGQGPR